MFHLLSARSSQPMGGCHSHNWCGTLVRSSWHQPQASHPQRWECGSISAQRCCALTGAQEQVFPTEGCWAILPVDTHNLVPTPGKCHRAGSPYFSLSLLCVCFPSLGSCFLTSGNYTGRVIPQASVLHGASQGRGLASCLITAPLLTRQQHLPVRSSCSLLDLWEHINRCPKTVKKSSPAS